MKIKTLTAETEQGPFLKVNEDNSFFNIADELFMIFDGFGGAGIGDQVTHQLKEDLNHFYQNITADRDATLPFFYSAKYLLEANALINSIISSNDKLYKQNLSKEFSKRGGASAIVAAMSESILNIVCIGNCRAYLIRESKIHKIFIEDSFQLLSAPSNKSSSKSIPLNAFGLYPDLSYQIKEVRHLEGDKVIFLTDGAYSELRDEELKNQFLNENISTRQRIKAIFDLNNSRGNLDNQSCMLLEF